MAWRGGLVVELKRIVLLPSRIIKYYTLNIIQKIPGFYLLNFKSHRTDLLGRGHVGLFFPVPWKPQGTISSSRVKIQNVSINKTKIFSIRNITEGKFLKKLILYISLNGPLISATLPLKQFIMILSSLYCLNPGSHQLFLDYDNNL